MTRDARQTRFAVTPDGSRLRLPDGQLRAVASPPARTAWGQGLQNPRDGCSRLLAAARAYAERLGWAVLPLAGKVPAIRGGRGYLDATSDPEMIRAYWGRYPYANIGASCIGSGFVTLDVDPRHGGDRTLAAIESRCGPLPHTVRQHTGGGSVHILFNAPRDFQPRGSIGSGVDVKWRGRSSSARASIPIPAASTPGRTVTIRCARRLPIRPHGSPSYSRHESSYRPSDRRGR